MGEKQLKEEEKRLKDQLPVLAEKRLHENLLCRKKKRPQSTTNEMFVAAAEAGEVSEVEQLLRDGAHINCIDTKGFTALHHATMAGNEALVKVLLTYDPNLQCKAPFLPLNAPLHFAAIYGYYMIMEMLLNLEQIQMHKTLMEKLRLISRTMTIVNDYKMKSDVMTEVSALLQLVVTKFKT